MLRRPRGQARGLGFRQRGFGGDELGGGDAGELLFLLGVGRRVDRGVDESAHHAAVSNREEVDRERDRLVVYLKHGDQPVHGARASPVAGAGTGSNVAFSCRVFGSMPSCVAEVTTACLKALSTSSRQVAMLLAKTLKASPAAASPAKTEASVLSFCLLGP